MIETKARGDISDAVVVAKAEAAKNGVTTHLNTWLSMVENLGSIG